MSAWFPASKRPPSGRPDAAASTAPPQAEHNAAADPHDAGAEATTATQKAQSGAESDPSGGSGTVAAGDAAAVHPDEHPRLSSKRRRISPRAQPVTAAQDPSPPSDAVKAGAEGRHAAAALAPPLPPLPGTRVTRGRAGAASQAAAKATAQTAAGRTSADESDSKLVNAEPATNQSGRGGGSGGGGGGTSGEAPATAVSDLDRERAEIMERNRRKLLELQLPGLVAGMTAGRQGGGAGSGKRPASQRGVGAKRSREAPNEPPPPRRVSLRQRGVAADSALAAGIEHESASGVQLVAGRQAAQAAAGAGDGAAGDPATERHPRGDLPFRSDNGDEATDAAFIAALKAAAAAAAAAAAPRGGADSGGADSQPRPDLGGEVLARLSLAERDVAKVTKDGVTHLAWLPGSERLLLAAADKSGKVSLWDVDVEEGGAAADTDGVLMFSPHSEYVSGMRWLGRDAAVGACRIITAAYDGSLRALDLGGAGMWLELPAPGDPRVAEFSALEVSSDGRTAFLGDPLGNLDVVDLRAPQPPQPQQQSQPQQQPGGPSSRSDLRGGGSPAGTDAQPGADAAAGPREPTAAAVGGLQICPRKINSLHLEPSAGHLLASSCSDGTVCIWDVRKLSTAAVGGGGGGARGKSHVGSAKALAVLHHGKSCHAAYWATDGSRRLLSTSYDDTIRIWSPAAAAAGAHSGQYAQELSIPHNNQTGRWITPFRAVWSPACDGVVVGNMRRGVDVFAAPAPSAASDGAADAAGGSGEGWKSPPGGKARLGGGKGGAKGGAGKHTAAGGGAAGTHAAGQLLRTLVSEHMSAIPSRMACHPLLPVVVAATSSGRCHVWR